MKLVKKFIFLVIILFINLSAVNAEVTMDQIINNFNSGRIAQRHIANGGTFTAKYDQDSIDVVIRYPSSLESYVFGLNGNIITNEYDGSSFDKDALNMFEQLVNEIGMLHGYDAYELSPLLISELADSYTLEKEGFELIKTQEKWTFKIDYTKKVPLIDFSDVYITEKDLSDLNEFVESGRLFGYCKIIGNVYLWIDFDNDLNMSILIGEKNKLQKMYINR